MNKKLLRSLGVAAVFALAAGRSWADMGDFHNEDDSQRPQAASDNGPQLSEPISDKFEQVKPLVDAKQWDSAIAMLDQMAATVDPSTYQGGYDRAVIEDTKAKILVQSDRLPQAIQPWEETLALVKKHPSYYYTSQIDEIVHYLAEIYSQVASSIKLNPGPDLAQRQDQQQQDFQKALEYQQRWMKSNPKMTQDDQYFYAEMLFNMAATTTGDKSKDFLKQAAEAAEKGLKMAVRPRDELYYLLADAAEQRSDDARAAEILELLVQHKPDSKTYYPQLMAMYLDLAGGSKQPTVAHNYYIRAINTIERAQAHGQMTDQKANLNLVTIYYDLNQFGQAASLLSAGLKDGRIDPAEANWKLLAYCYEQLEEFPKAVEAYKQAADVFPDDGELDVDIGQIYYQSMNDAADSYQFFVEAAQKGHVSRPYSVYLTIAYCAYELQKYPEALKACDEAAKYPEAATDSQLSQIRQAVEDRLKATAGSKAQQADNS